MHKQPLVRPRPFAGRVRSFLLWLVFTSLSCQANDAPQRVLFGGDAEFPPLEWMEKNQAKGFNVELAREIAKTGGSKAEHQLGNWPDMMRALEEGRIDVMPMYYSAERAKRFIFTHAYYYPSHSIYALPGAVRVSSIDNLHGHKVVVEQESFAHQQLRSSAIQPELVVTANTVTAIEALLHGDAEYAVLTSLAVDSLLKKNDWRLERMGVPFWSRGYAFAVNKNKPELAEWLQDSLSETIASGRYQQLYEKWVPELEPSAADTSLMNSLWLALATIVALLLIAAGWYWSIKRTVAVHTRELRDALTQREMAEHELRYLANFDAQTGLAKLQHFIEQVDDYFHSHQQPVKQEKEILIVKLVDLDVIVRTFGFSRAELVVNAFAMHLVKLTDAMSAYLGRGVFAIFTNKCNAQVLLDRLMTDMSNSDPGLNSQFVGGSAYWPEHGRSAGKLMRHAETAMAMSVARRRRWMAYETAMEPSRLDLDIISIFIDGNVQGLFPVFQPQLDLRSGKITSAEILVRWQHPRLGFIPPNVFIPLLENSGLIEQVTAQMIDEAVRVAVLLRKRNLPCAISVNIAAFDLIETNLGEAISHALVRYQGLPSDIKLELTETSVASDPQRVKQVLLELSELGVYASVDDFGTGYSSLSYLSLFPIRELKIDRTFVSDMIGNPRNHSIVRSTILMARELGLTTVAEGVEDDQTLQMLKKDGCDLAQGYVIAKPMAEVEFIEFMRAHAAQVFDVSQFMKR
ncbi:EAL domain-containing protein [Cellvibrio sp. KY-GH-1]|uniref:EAL domain-containing protein n=1 Tax=Cellvibrio sp. KY-GH-1 TaxID=2303332 RepID=UPI001247B9CB|nr:EAL domain-containing protein [Cellvibrio sp. KY-GH-1]QEY18156.1 EAL domain-containing protein [Cellvibrio sp. KY-GH-1]